MKDENMRFGEFIRSRRMRDEREMTLREVSEILGISLSMLSDIEQKRRKPFSDDKIVLFAEYFGLSDDELALMRDLAAKETRDIPSDIEDTMMYSGSGTMARRALRMTNEGLISEDDWKEFIRQAESRKEND